MRFVRSAVLVTAAAAVALIPTAANANTYRHTDAASDVVALSGSSGTVTPQPDRANGDVIGSSVRHTNRKIIAQMTFRDLANADGFNGYAFSIKSNKVRRDVTVVGAAGIPSQVVVTKANGKKVSGCKVKRNIDLVAKSVTVKVPRKCLDNPKWVKVGMATVFMTGFAPTDTQYADDAQFSGPIQPKSPLTYSPKIRR